jgi:hypothetical protein
MSVQEYNPKKISTAKTKAGIELQINSNLLLSEKVTLMALIRDDRNAVSYSPSGYLDARSRYYREVTPNSVVTDNLFTTTIQFGLPASASQASNFANFNPSLKEKPNPLLCMMHLSTPAIFSIPILYFGFD